MTPVFVAICVVLLLSWVALAFLLLLPRFQGPPPFTKVTIPAVTEPFPPLPQMTEASKTIEGAASEAAKKLAADIEFYGMPAKDGLGGLFSYYDEKRNSDDDWSSVEKPKRKKRKKTSARVRRPKK